MYFNIYYVAQRSMLYQSKAKINNNYKCRAIYLVVLCFYKTFQKRFTSNVLTCFSCAMLAYYNVRLLNTSKINSS